MGEIWEILKNVLIEHWEWIIPSLLFPYILIIFIARSRTGVLSDRARLRRDRFFLHLAKVQISLKFPGDELAAQLSKLEKGKIVHAIPEIMRVGESERAIARISRDLAMNFFKYLPEETRVETDHIDLGSAMGVKLAGERADSFEITPLTAEEQIIPEDGFAHWEWSVVPKLSGLQWLIISATAVLYLKNGATGKSTIETYRRDVNVLVQSLPKRMLVFVKNNWKWLVGRF